MSLLLSVRCSAFKSPLHQSLLNSAAQVFNDPVWEPPSVPTQPQRPPPAHTDLLCSAFCPGRVQTHWPRFTSRLYSPLIRGSRGLWLRAERTAGAEEKGTSEAKKALSPLFPTLCHLVRPLATNVHSVPINCAGLCSSEMLISDVFVLLIADESSSEALKSRS